MDRTISVGTYFFRMTNPTLVLLQLMSFFAAVLFLVLKFKNRHFNKLASGFPGPPPLPVIGNALELYNFNYDILSWIRDLKDRYQTPVKVHMGPELWIFLTKPEDLQIVLNSHHTLEKAKIYRFIDEFIGNGLLSAPAEKWKKHRKLLTPAFHLKVLEQLLPIFNGRAFDLVRRLEPNSKNGEEFDVWPHVISVAITTIFQTALGIDITHDRVLLEKIDKMVQRGSELLKKRLFTPWLHSRFVYARLNDAKELKEIASAVQEMLEKILRTKKAEFIQTTQRSSTPNGCEETQINVENFKGLCLNEKKNMMRSAKKDVIWEKQNVQEQNHSGLQQSSIFIDILLEQGIANSFTDKELMDEIAIMIMAGSDTCAITISFCLLSLAINQDVQEKVFEEQMSIFHAADRPVNNDDLSKMVYTEQVIKEILRLYPAGPITARSAGEDIKLSGDYTIPSGAQIILSPFLTHHDQEIWPDADEFNPENFSAENVMKRHKYAFLPFSGGPRGCIGSKYGMMSLKTTLSIISRHYKVTTTTKKEDIKVEMVVLLRCCNGYNISLKPRTDSNLL